MKMTDNEVKQERRGSVTSEWISYGSNIDVHEGLFNLGLLAVRQSVFKGEVTSRQFSVGKRELVTKDSSVLSTQHTKLISSLNQYQANVHKSRNLSHGNDEDTNSECSSLMDDGMSTSPESLAASPMSISPRNERINSTLIPVRPQTVIANPLRKDEVFVPVILHEEKTRRKQAPDLGMYLYPWLSTDTAKEVAQFEFLGFEQYVTAGCLFGPNIVGCHENSSSIGLIKHDIKLNAKIESIEYDDRNNPYTQALFDQFKCFCKLMNSYCQEGKPVNLLYHLPTWDYILFGVELYLRGWMSSDALSQFVDAIRTEASIHHKRLTHIAEKYNIRLTIASPFDNLFGDFFELAKQSPLTVIFNALELNQTETEFDSLDTEEQKAKEAWLVKKCVELLRRNHLHQQQSRVWNDFLKDLKEEEIPRNLEELFKIANATMIALASHGKGKHKTCSLLPLSEKQIQVSYSRYSKNMRHCTPVVNMTVLDALLSYAPNRPKGQVFYFTTLGRNTLAELNEKKRHGTTESSEARQGSIGRNSFLKEARRNVVRSAQGEEPLSLQSFLNLRK